MLPVYLHEKAKVRHISSAWERKFLGFYQTLIIYSFKVSEKEIKAQQRLALTAIHHQIQRTVPSPLGEVGDAVSVEVKDDHCSPEASSSLSSQRGLF